MELINKEDAVALIKAEMDKIRTHSLVDGTARINLRLAKNIIEDMPTIDIADYVPKDFHDKTCEAMAKRHQEEIADMVSVVRCKECRHWIGETEHYEDREYKACWQLCGQYMNSEFWCKYGEREGE
jgi:hypothetical protein